MLSSILVIVVNLIVDIIYCFLDPRIEVSNMSTFWQRYKRNKSAVFALCHSSCHYHGGDSKLSCTRSTLQTGWKALSGSE